MGLSATRPSLDRVSCADLGSPVGRRLLDSRGCTGLRQQLAHGRCG